MFNNKYPYTDFHELNLDWLLGQAAKFKNIEDEEVRNYVTPEMFGAVGDGNHDDILSFEKAVNTKLPIVGDPSKIYAISHGINLLAGSYICNCKLKAIDYFNDMIAYDYRNTVIENMQIDCNNMANYGIHGSSITPSDASYVAQIRNCYVQNARQDGFHTGKVRTFYNSCIARNCGSSGFVIGATDTKHDNLTAIDCKYGVFVGYQIGNTSIGRLHPWAWDKKQVGMYVSTQSQVNIDYFFDDSNEIGIMYRSGNQITIGTLQCFNNTNAPAAVDSSCRLFEKDSDGLYYTTMISINTLSGTFSGYDDYFLIPDIDINYLDIKYNFITNVSTRFDKKMLRLTAVPSTMFSDLLSKFTISSTPLTIDTIEMKKANCYVDGYKMQLVVTFNAESGLPIDETVDALNIVYNGTETLTADYKLENILSSFSAPAFHIVQRGSKGVAVRFDNAFTITGTLILTIELYVTLY